MNIPDDAFYTLLNQALAQRGEETLQRALYHALQEAILRGTLGAKSRLPGSRAMAQTLTVSRNTVNGALEQLATEGYLLRDRQGSRVAILPQRPVVDAPEPPAVRLPPHLARLPAGTQRDSPTLMLTPGTPAVNYFPLPLWRRIIDRTLREEGSALLGYGDSAGEMRLREAIARHLTLSRAISCDASQIVITEGALEGLTLCARLLSEAGETAWVEEPGYVGAKSAFLSAGLHVVGIPVGEEGMQPEGNAPLPRLIFTSPSHQYPYGTVLSASRRLALLEFARKQGAWIVEDDYDSEFRYSGEPIPAMLGMMENAPVVYLGTFSKTLFPALRIGFMVMPKVLAAAVQPLISSLLRGGHRTEQVALAHFIEEGHYARHLASMRRLYRKRQLQLREAIGRELLFPHQIIGGGGGMHLTVQIDGIDDVAVVQQARQYQLAPAALSRFWLDETEARSGLVLGYGSTSASQFPAALRTLQQIMRRCRRG
ncbi:MAG: PLP-dependent aminotransferase family protein [Yokenella regensburgei]|uniref:GntR family transcriptional regulator/MocR family aminotransferase n=1 Tax=Yokenella regensburgei TaxID=158877 RepID=A0ABX9RT62_9ENTR|nr:PLP-dependent aminotransferase family protein [Yokenella regensburgei]MDR3105767.1 PLP-dependent aminotransferase family protein [Yokenella regensburgei]QIU92049.1 PLP-dependent aminotransferase family protein [Yokenella regensburgei]RKR53117.1 GntR family transcriptional regulator/MocR family aminotransferase [Yokenella regensburgei]VFS35859.1 HTH-type transcriptional regulatory protein gabR [Yokenella regensburgei]